MRPRPSHIATASLAALLVGASAFALAAPTPVTVEPAAQSSSDDDPSTDDLGVTGDDVADDAPSPDDSPSTDDSPSPDDSPSTDDSPSPDDAASAPRGSETYTVVDAGTVTVAATPDGLVVTAVSSAAGWSGHVDWAQGRQVEVTFRSGDARVDFKAEVEDGEVRIRIRDRRLEDLEDDDRSGSSDDDGSDDADDDSGSDDDVNDEFDDSDDDDSDDDQYDDSDDDASDD